MAGPAVGESVNDELVIVVESIALEKVAVGAMVTATPVALLAGVFAVTVGAELTVVKVQVTAAASATPSEALTAVVRKGVEEAMLGSGAVGGSVAMVPL